MLYIYTYNYMLHYKIIPE